MSAGLRTIGRDAAGRPRTLLVRERARRQVAYRRLVITILGLDLATLTSELRAMRHTQARRLQSAA